MLDRADLDEALEAAARVFKVWRAVAAVRASRIMRRRRIMRGQRRDRAAMDDGAGKTLAKPRWKPWLPPTIIDGFRRGSQSRYWPGDPARGPGIYQIAIKEPVGPVAAQAVEFPRSIGRAKTLRRA